MIFSGLSLLLFVLLMILFLVVLSSSSLYSSFEYNINTSNTPSSSTVFLLKW